MRDYRRLLVWSKAHKLALTIYELTRLFPPEERFGLTSQMRRSAVSVASNIADGFGRASDKDFARFLDIAPGSNCELEYQLLLATDLGYVKDTRHLQTQTACREVRQMLAGLHKKLVAGS